MKISSTTPVALKNATAGSMVMALSGTTLRVTSPSVCTRSPHRQPPQPNVPSSCPGVPPLASTYFLTGHVRIYDSFTTYQDSDFSATLTQGLGCEWGGTYTGGGIANLQLIASVAWRLSLQAGFGFATSDKVSGSTPLGTFPDIIGFVDPFSGLFYDFTALLIT